MIDNKLITSDNMTTIAWDGKTLAGDCCSWSGGVRRKTRKVFKIKSPTRGMLLVGFVGQQSFAYAVADWIKGERDIPNYKEFGVEPQNACAVVIDSKNRIYVLGCTLEFNLMRENIFAIGAGSEFAWGALEMGATSKQAVKIAEKRSDYAAMGIDCISF